MNTPDRQATLVSLVTPAFNESENLPVLYERLRGVLDGLEVRWEWIVIDDHSSDETFETLQELARRDSRVRGLRFARNSGSHTAIACGLAHCRGDCAVVLAADLQDPPETMPELLKCWEAGAQVVWAVRAERAGETVSTRGFAGLYYWLMRRVVGMKEMPSTGADFFLADRRVVEALNGFRERNVSLLALITWMGFRQASIPYAKDARLHGQSGWTLGRKLKLVVDSITAFSYLPIRWMTYLGAVVAMLGFVYAGFVIFNAIAGTPQSGWSSLMVVVLVLGGVQMLMMGVLGEYLWRSLDEARHRPRYLIEAVTAPEVSDEGFAGDRTGHGEGRQDP